jgi:protein phosphatase
VRGSNEDNLYVNGVTLTAETRAAAFALEGAADAPCLFAVCDGMGGEEDGEFASLTAVGTLATFAERIRAAAPQHLDALVQEYVAGANAALCAAMGARGVRMGTTLALAALCPEGVHTYSIGDSRIYALCGGAFRQLSTDHTLVTPKIKMGLLTEEEARKDKDWHKLTAYLGVFEDESEVCADVLPVLPLKEGARLLLCSDGLTDMVPDHRIEQILRDAAAAENAADTLLEEALANGGKDNVTVVLLDVPPHQQAGQARKASLFGLAKLAVTELPKIFLKGTGGGRK